jgi:uncharacterized membrane protein
MSPLLVILIVLLIVVAMSGTYGYRSGWYAGSPYGGAGFGIVGVVLIVLLILALTGRL